MKLIVITDWSVPDCLARAAAAAAVSSDVVVQHRHHGVSAAQFEEEALRLRELCPRLFINSDAALATRLGAGLHLPERLSVPEFDGPLTKSTHSPLPAGERVRVRGQTTFLVSPVYAPLSKREERGALGPSGFHAIAATLPGPAFALGGLTADRIAALKPLAGIAVIGAVMHAPDAARATEALLRALE